ncbi:MAG: cytochrome c [Oligoflexales bacterium]|nr:cytochrome c [Oligoflexales bacterium]
MRKIYADQKQAFRIVFFCSFFVLLCSCDPSETNWQYMPDMVDGPMAKAQRTYINPPEGSIARNAILYPKTPEESELVMHSPYSGHVPDETVLEEGRHLFQTFCAVCHGSDAKGAGHLADKFPPAPDLTGEVYQKRGDGFFFHRITFGSVIMPSYGHAISLHERWKLIAYLREKLQKKNSE